MYMSQESCDVFLAERRWLETLFVDLGKHIHPHPDCPVACSEKRMSGDFDKPLPDCSATQQQEIHPLWVCLAVRSISAVPSDLVFVFRPLIGLSHLLETFVMLLRNELRSHIMMHPSAARLSSPLASWNNRINRLRSTPAHFLLGICH